MSTPSPVDPDDTALVRFSFLDLDLTVSDLPIPLRAEIVARDAAGGVVARSCMGRWGLR